MTLSETMDNGTPPARSAEKQAGGLRLEGQRVLVVGMAATGVAAARFLRARGAIVTATDLRAESDIPGSEDLKGLGVELSAGGHPEGLLDGTGLVVVSPGVPRDIALLRAARARGIEVISEIELASRFIATPVVAVAGTNGKSTVVSLLGEMFKRAGVEAFVGGNLGTPAVEFAASGGTDGVCVLEVSSFQLETTRLFRPRVAVLLNITEDHLDRYSCFDDYAGTKFRLFENQTNEDHAVVNASDPVIAKRLKEGFFRAKVTPFSTTGELDTGLYLRGTEIVYATEGHEETYPLEGIRIKGLHNMENAMAAIAVARLSGVSREAVVEALSEFRGLGHRMETVRTLDDVAYVDDSKGTNVGALVMALKGLTTPVVLIAGGRDKGGDYSILKDLVREKVKLLVLIGEARFKMKEALGSSAETVLADTLEEAVSAARLGAAPGDTVLLCPACSSFDMFRDYKERGDRFRALVEDM